MKQCVGVSASVRVYERVLPYLYQYTERRSRGGAAAVVLQRFANKKWGWQMADGRAALQAAEVTVAAK